MINTSGQHAGSFKGVIKRKAKAYFLSGIDPDSNEDGIRDFLSQNDVISSKVNVFKPRCGETLVAKITIWEEHAQVVESELFWPSSVTCKAWMTKPELRLAYKQRTGTESSDNGKYN